MNPADSPAPTPDPSRFLIRGIHLELTEALQQAALFKASRLFRHHQRILRIRIDLAHDETHPTTHAFVATGRLEVSGPDLVASATSENAYKSIDLLVDKLDVLLRRRHQKRVNTRNDARRQAPDTLHGKA
ncbi:MAG TPA: ribosome-associated translation inhibitor RaiA [Lacunisphaera sp.]|nr:ribosome-associated translation inhibitor RaiA [Lacunisphaera sp.]